MNRFGVPGFESSVIQSPILKGTLHAAAAQGPQEGSSPLEWVLLCFLDGNLVFFEQTFAVRGTNGRVILLIREKLQGLFFLSQFSKAARRPADYFLGLLWFGVWCFWVALAFGGPSRGWLAGGGLLGVLGRDRALWH